MAKGKDMSLALDRVLATAPVRPEGPATDGAEPRLNIAVVFTSIESTFAALKRAGVLASRLGAHITLVVPQVVPYPLPLESPPVLLDFSERRFRAIASESPVETSVRLYLCRNALETLTAVLPPDSLIILAGRKRWRPTAEKSLARKLRCLGHKVVFTETE